MNNLKQSAQRYLNTHRQTVADVVQLLGGQPGLDPRTVLPLPTPTRRDAPAIQLTSHTETELRRLVAQFGLGSEHDVIGIGQVALHEGGLVWKMRAEAAVSYPAQVLIFAGCPHVTLRDDELDYVARMGRGVQLQGTTQYDAARLVAQELLGFVPNATEEILPFGYEVAQGNAFVTQATGQLTKIGESAGRPVLLLRVDQEDYTNNEGQKRYRYRPDASRLLTFVSEVLSACGDEDSAVMFVTSSAYAAKAASVIRTGLASARQFAVTMYGRRTLNVVRGPGASGPVELNQIPGEVRVLHEELDMLQQLLEQIG